MSDPGTRLCALEGCGESFVPSRANHRYHTVRCGHRAAQRKYQHKAFRDRHEAKFGTREPVSVQCMYEPCSRWFVPPFGFQLTKVYCDGLCAQRDSDKSRPRAEVCDWCDRRLDDLLRAVDSSGRARRVDSRCCSEECKAERERMRWRLIAEHRKVKKKLAREGREAWPGQLEGILSLAKGVLKLT